MALPGFLLPLLFRALLDLKDLRVPPLPLRVLRQLLETFLHLVIPLMTLGLLLLMVTFTFGQVLLGIT
jgi:hypothetical protein